MPKRQQMGGTVTVTAEHLAEAWPLSTGSTRTGNMTVLHPPTTTKLSEARDELYREFKVRERCFPRWVEEGRVTLTDAQDRLNRIHTAFSALAALVESQEQSDGLLVTSSGDMTLEAAQA